jgi:hypothetical protein
VNCGLSKGDCDEVEEVGAALEGDERFSCRIKHFLRKQLASMWLRREQKSHFVRFGVEEKE